jgi:beta-lactamase class D
VSNTPTNCTARRDNLFLNSDNSRRRASKRCGAGLMLVLLNLSLTALAQDHVAVDLRANAAIEASGYTGTILLYNPIAKSWRAGHPQLADQSFIPASTFKIFSALVALEVGVIENIETVIKWDGVTRSRPAINRDLDLKSAFQLSAVPHFQGLVRQIGAQQMQHYIDAAGYGNQDISGGIDTFWLTGNLRISPRQQVIFLTRLYQGQLPFSTPTMDAVKTMMATAIDQDHVLRAKTGWAVLEGNQNTGWWVGWVERGDEVQVFATLLKTTLPGADFGPARLSVTRQALGSEWLPTPN